MATYYGRKYKLLELRHRFKEGILAAKIMLKSKSLGKPRTAAPLYIAMVDGETFHGGLCDRFKGIISLYAYCKYRGLPFRIRYTYPFRLEDYLAPAAYDWTLRQGEYTDNPLYSRILYMRGEHLAARLLTLNTRKQIHFYTNRDLLAPLGAAYAGGTQKPAGWGELYRELFRPAPVLEERLRLMKEETGSDYYAAVFRFQNLLGDFHEYRYRALADPAESERLIRKCLDAISRLKASHGDTPLLVTSDSVTFLKRAARLEGVHIIPGTLTHIDGNKRQAIENPFEVYLKSFTDFYMLTGARKIYRVGTPQMYPSEFPVYAAKVNGIPFESVAI